jgi:hypothetical protein
VSGAVSASVNGCASYTVSLPSSTPTTIIALTAGNSADNSHHIGIIAASERPATGSYLIGKPTEADLQGSFTLDGGDGPDRFFVLTSGSLNITASSAGTLSATFVSVTGTEGGPGGPTVTLSGSFTAKCVDASDREC